MKKIIALWAVPRSRSTAFQWMMQQRGDFQVLHEPFGHSAFYSEERIFKRNIDVPPQSKYNYQRVLQDILSSAEKKQLWVKDFPYNFIHIVDEQFISYFQHSFLIRHPAQVIPSLFHKWPDIQIEEIGYQELYILFEKIKKQTGNIPPLIDADDLVKHPQATVQAYCETVGIPFIPEALQWEKPKSGKEVSWYDEGSWHSNLITTTGFQEQNNPDYLTIDENDDLKRLYDLCLPYYEKLHSYKLSADE